jgi:putative transposase
VALHAWALMKNHYHLVLSELVEGGLTLFLRKLSGYARYFNDRHERKGALLQGRTKKVLIKDERHFLYILHYTHLNPLDYLPGAETWRERDKGVLPGVSLMLRYLETYRWSSYRDYLGIRNFPSVIDRGPFDLPPREYAASLRVYLSDRVDGLDESALEYN